jgi:hypothetical protein
VVQKRQLLQGLYVIMYNCIVILIMFLLGQRKPAGGHRNSLALLLIARMQLAQAAFGLFVPKPLKRPQLKELLHKFVPGYTSTS